MGFIAREMAAIIDLITFCKWALIKHAWDFTFWIPSKRLGSV